MLKKILFILDNKQKKELLIFYFLSLLIIFFELLSIGIIVPVVNVILDPIGTEKYLKYLPFEFSNINSSTLTFYILALFNVLIILKNIFIFFALKFQAKFIGEYQQKLQMKLFKNYLYQPISSLVKNNISIINRNVIDISSDYTNVLVGPLMTILSDIVLFICILAILIFAEPLITIIGLVITLIIGASIFLINKKILISSGELYKFNKGERIKSLNETFGAILEVKSFSKEILFTERFEKFTKILRDIQIKLSIIGFLPKLLFEVMAICLITIFFLVLFNRMDSLDQVLAVVVLFAFAIIKITPLANKILVNSQRIRYSQPLINEIYFVLSNFAKKDDDTKKLLKFTNKIDLANISYKYEKSNYILKEVNLSIKKNSFIAITGKSGSGKTTLLKLILGLLKPTDGNILLDGQPIHSNSSSWQEKVNFVPQDVFILDDSLIKNITLETDKNKIDLDRLELAVKSANLKEFIELLPNKYETILGDKGSRISGGQKQRIGLARAIYGNAEIIVLDESTSSIDDINEAKIFKNLKELNKSKTIIFVTHKNSMKDYFDKIYFIENGTLKKQN